MILLAVSGQRRGVMTCSVFAWRPFSQLKKKRPTVATVFKCLYCNHDGAIECNLDFKAKVGTLKCRICGVDWQTRIHYLSEPIDVYSEFIDAAEAEKTSADRDLGQAEAAEDELS